MLDVRKPVGYLFLILGLILVGYGLLQIPKQPTEFQLFGPTAYYLNLPWGGMMAAFGVGMLCLAYLEGGGKEDEDQASEEADEDEESEPENDDTAAGASEEEPKG